MKKDAFMQICRSKATQALTAEQENFFGTIGEALEQAVAEEGVERTKALNSVLAKLGEVPEGETLASVVRGMAQTIEDIEKKAKRGLTNSQRFNLMSKLEEKRDVIQRARKSNEAWDIEFHAKRTASALMQTSTVLTGATAFNNPNIFDDMDVVFIQYPANFILDAVNARQVSKVPSSWKWKEQVAAGTGAAASTAEGTTKPLMDYKFEWKYADRVKYAGRIEVTEEVEIDFEQLMLDIVNMFERDVVMAWQDGVLTAITNYATTYAGSALDGKIIKPSVYSVIGALKLQAQAANYEPNIVILNPGDAAEAIYLQDADGAQQFIPADLQFGGLRPFISNKIAAGTVVVGTSATIQEQHGAFIIRKGVSGTQFIENESTIVGEVFSVLKMPTASAASWVKGDIATVKGLLLAPGA